jgi:2-polyprenyl-3-methyl-5-hydroxy-6-metoxy-1,4-benzoquinol methylase
MSYPKIALEDIALDPETQRVYEDYVERFGTERKRGIYRYKNFPRFSHVLGLLEPGKRILDIGVFTGQFLDILALSGRFNKVIGIDIVKKPGFHTLSGNYEFHIADCRELPFETDSFDAVICMEVLEHLEVEDFPKALLEIRRVCKKQLVMSVPYDEQPPLSQNHRQAFDDEKLLKWFPDAEATILTEREKDIWIMLSEQL